MASIEHKALALFLVGCGWVAYEQRNALIASFQPLSSPIDWCEENYAVTEYIVEFWNSISSLFLIAVAFIAQRFVDKRFAEVEPGVTMLWAVMVFVGIGSTLFHGTLSIAGQVLDELPISLLSMFACFMLRPSHKWNPTVRRVVFSNTFFIAVTVGSTLACTLYPVLSHIFCVSWIPVVLYSFFQEFYESSPEGRSRAKFMLGITILSFGMAFTCWLLDRFACETMRDIFPGIPFHALWHVFVSFTFWAAVGTGIILRAYAEGEEVHLKPTSFIMPHIVLGKVV